MLSVLYFICFGLSYIAVRLYRQTILNSLPALIRKREDQLPIANGAGSALWDVSLLFSIYLILYQNASLHRMLFLLLATLSFMLLGWVDDWLELKPKTKFLFQTGLALVLVPLYFRINGFGMGIAGQMLCILLLVWLVNAINFLDILDGAASSVAVLILMTLAFIFKKQGMDICSRLSLFWIFSLFGFLLQNVYKPSVFLGDAGAHLLGSVLFFLSLDFFSHSGLTYVHSASILTALFGFIIFDFSYVCLRRIIKKIPPFVKSEDHLMFTALKYTGSRYAVLIIFLFFQGMACILAWNFFVLKQ